jgi:uncharacterized protein YdhG (YjbR/CyaY superfamily)
MRGGKMKRQPMVPTTIDEYVADFPRPVQAVLKRVRAAIKKAVPGAEEAISYRIPTFKLHGRNVIYFAGWKAHYSLYPANDQMVAEFGDRLAPYEVNGKGTIRFPLDAPVPVELIADIARFRAQEVKAAAMLFGPKKAAAKKTTAAKQPVSGKRRTASRQR